MGQETCKCACKGSNLDKLIQPVILLILREGNDMGYGIIKKMEKFSMFENGTPDATGVYRQLRIMEEKGNIAIVEKEEAPQGVKKLYCITEEGKACLENWKSTLEAYEFAVREIREKI